MLKIKRSNFKEAGHDYRYELEDGTYLHQNEWNGEEFTVKEKRKERRFRPVYENEGTDEEEIIGFEEL